METHDMDALYAPFRTEGFTILVLDGDDRPLGEEYPITGGSMSFSTDARIKGGGQLEVEAKKPADWWGRKRFQIWCHVNGYAWPLGVFLPASPANDHSGNGVSYSIELQDKLLVLDQDQIEAALSIPVDTNLVDYITRMIRDAGERKVAITPSDKTNKRPLVWDAGTAKLTVINDILDYIGYFSLTCNGYGQMVASPYVVPAERPVNWEFWEGDRALFTPEYTHEQDLMNIPNKIVYVCQSSGFVEGPFGVEIVETPMLVGVATNEDPESPYSFQSRGRWITETKTDVEAESQEIIDKMAQTRLENAMDPLTKVTAEAALLPLALNDILHFRTEFYDMFMSVRKYEIDLVPGSLMTVTLRKVNRED